MGFARGKDGVESDRSSFLHLVCFFSFSNWAVRGGGEGEDAPACGVL